jgi:hypothetical protein
MKYRHVQTRRTDLCSADTSGAAKDPIIYRHVQVQLRTIVYNRHYSSRIHRSCTGVKASFK